MFKTKSVLLSHVKSIRNSDTLLLEEERLKVVLQEVKEDSGGRRGNCKYKDGCKVNTTKSIRDSTMSKRDGTRSKGRLGNHRLRNHGFKDGCQRSSFGSTKDSARSFKKVEYG